MVASKNLCPFAITKIMIFPNNKNILFMSKNKIFIFDLEKIYKNTIFNFNDIFEDSLISILSGFGSEIIDCCKIESQVNKFFILLNNKTVQLLTTKSFLKRRFNSKNYFKRKRKLHRL